MASAHFVESFSPAERDILARHVTNVDGPVFALTELPEVTRAALFARYSRSPKSLRRLLLDEFAPAAADRVGVGAPAVGAERAADLFGRVLTEYGDDSVAQLAGVHLAVEQASQLLAKAIEWGRLGAYLEQSTRYIAYTDLRGGRYRYHRDPDVGASELAGDYEAAMDGLFEAYTSLLAPLQAHLDATAAAQEDGAARRRAIRALSLDIARGLLPAGTVSNVGIFASPQAYEHMVMRLRAHELPEARRCGDMMSVELRRVIPDFLSRLERPDRGGAWVDYLRETAAAVAHQAQQLPPPGASRPPLVDLVRLVEWEPDAEDRVIAAALYPYAQRSVDDLLAAVRELPAERRHEIMRAAVGERGNRRHRPGRAFEHATYAFEVVSDYGAFRDLQRHRMLTIQWQSLTPALGYTVPGPVTAAGLEQRWRDAVNAAEDVYGSMQQRFPQQAAYLVTLGHRVRYLVRLNAREAMHMIELRTAPQGHASYVRICREMHRQIAEIAGHHLIAGAMRFVGSDDVHLPRYASEAARETAGRA